jgi:hypothetical protein
VKQLPQLHCESKQNREQPRNHAPQAQRGITDRLAGDTGGCTGGCTLKSRDEGLAEVRLAHAQVECWAASICQDRARSEHRRGHRERGGTRLDTEGRHRGNKPTAGGERHDKSACDHRRPPRGQDPRARLLSAPKMESTAFICAVERGSPRNQASKFAGKSPRSSGAVATVTHDRRDGGQTVVSSLRSLRAHGEASVRAASRTPSPVRPILRELARTSTTLGSVGWAKLVK